MNKKYGAAVIVIIILALFYIFFYSPKMNKCHKKDVSKSNLGKVYLDENKFHMDTALYLAIGNPDTALALFMYEKFNKYDYDAQREEYIRWELENKTLQSLFDSLFMNKSNYEIVISEIRKNESKFKKDAESALIEEYDRYHSITELMELEYLFQIRDSVLKEVLNDMIKNKKVLGVEKDKARAVLQKW